MGCDGVARYDESGGLFQLLCVGHDPCVVQASLEDLRDAVVRRWMAHVALGGTFSNHPGLYHGRYVPLLHLPNLLPTPWQEQGHARCDRADARRGGNG